MKRELLAALAVLLLLTGCGSSDTSPTWANELLATETTAGTHSSAAVKAVKSEGTLNQGIHFILYTDGELKLTGGDITSSLADDQRLRNEWDSITTVVFGEGVTMIGEKCAGELGTKKLDIVIGDSVTTIANQAFRNAVNIRSLQLGSGLENIGDYAFVGCTGLTELILPEGLRSVGAHAFDGCTSLRRLSIPASVTEIGEMAFKDDKSIDRVDLLGRTYREFCDAMDQPADGWYDWREGSSITAANCREESTGRTGASYSDWRTQEIVKKGRLSSGAEFILYESGRLYLSGADSIGRSLKQETQVLTSDELSKITTVEFADDITAIGDSVCEGMSSLTSVVIGNSVRSIGSNAFRDCTLLKSVTLPASVMKIGVKAFSGDNQITDFSVTGRSLSQMMQDLDPGVDSWYNWREDSSIKKAVCRSSIADPAGADQKIWNVEKKGRLKNGSVLYVLYSDKELVLTGGDITAPLKNESELLNEWNTITSLTFGEGVTVIGPDAAGGCTNITAVDMNDCVQIIDDNAFEGCSQLSTVSFGSGLTQIGSNAFESCTSLRNIKISSALVRIGSKAFAGCTSLKKAELGQSLQVISDNAFSNCSLLETVSWGSRLTTIGDYAFLRCTSLLEVTLGSGITSTGAQVFSGCTALKTVSISCDVTDKEFEDCTGITTIDFYHGVTSIGQYAFKGCSKITNVVLPEGLTEIGREAFANCTSLTEVTLPESLTRIGRHVFQNDSQITTVFLVNRNSYSLPSMTDAAGNWYAWNEDIQYTATVKRLDR